MKQLRVSVTRNGILVKKQAGSRDLHGESFVVIHPTNCCCCTDRHVADSIGLEELKRSLVQQSHILLLTKRVAT